MPSTIFTKIRTRKPVSRFATKLPIRRDASVESSLQLFLFSALFGLGCSLRSKFGSPAPLNSVRQPLTRSPSHFLSHVLHIVGLSSCEQMVWVKAKLDITRVANNHPVRYIADKFSVSNSVGVVAPAPVGHSSIPACRSASVYPTVIEKVDSMKESINSIKIFHVYNYSTREISDVA